jgi:hypothetical protein
MALSMADDDNSLKPQPIQAEDATKTPTGGYLYPDDEALDLCIKDLDRCDSFMNINIWASNWILAETLVQSPQNTNMLIGNTRTNIPVFTLSNHISAIVPKIMGGLFYENPPFLLRPRPGTTQDLVQAKSAVFAYQLEDMEFEEQTELAVSQMATLGTCIMKWGWTEREETCKVYKQKAPPAVLDGAGDAKTTVHTEESDEFEVTYETKKICRPWIKFVDIRTVRVDPGCRVGDIRTAKYVIHTEYPTYRDLDNLRGQQDYDIPSEAELKKFFEREKGSSIPYGDNLAMTMPEGMRGWLQVAVPRNQKTTADPLQAPLLLIERQDCHSIITVLAHGTDYILIRNSENPAGKTQYLSANWRNLEDAFWGQGLGMLIGVNQIMKQGLQNLAVDLIGYGLHPQLVRKKGFNTPTQSIIWRQGGIIDVDDDVEKAVSVLEMPQPPASAWQFLQVNEQQAQETSGANQQTTLGASGGASQSTGMRSGTGAAAVQSAAASRLDGPIERFVRQIFEPFLRIMDELNNEYLPASVLRDILDEQGINLMKFDHIKYRNAKLEYEVLAGSHLGPKKEMAQFMPFLLQVVNNPVFMQAASEQGMAFNFNGFFKMFTDLAGFKYSQNFFTKMDDQTQQRHDANSPSAIAQAKAQSAQQMQQTQFAQEEKMENQKEIGRAANQVLRIQTEHATDSELAQQTGGEGFSGE